MLDFYRFSHFQNDDTLYHGVTTKSSNAPYYFSLALHTGENQEKIIQNRLKVTEYFSHQALLHYIVAQQTHSDKIHIVTEKATKGWHSQQDAIVDCDALITNQINIILTILTADCVPILLYDKEKKVIAAIHAGWKGTKSEILTKTVKKMIQKFHTSTQNIIAGIAPSIGSCCYEVGYDVAQHFSHISGAYKQHNNKYMLDLPSINKKQLLALGIPEQNIEMSNICTSCKVDRFFSYRKEQGCSGRFMSMIGIREKESK